MSNLPRVGWALRRQAMPPSWRAITEEPFWDRWPVVISSNQAARPNYEVWVHGRPFVNRPMLSQAKEAVEERFGPQEWQRKRLPKIEVEHYYFGPTTEFTDPITLWVVEDDLRREAGRNRLYDVLAQAGAVSDWLAHRGYKAKITEGGSWALLTAPVSGASLEVYWEVDDLGQVVQHGVKTIEGGVATERSGVSEAVAVLEAW